MMIAVSSGHDIPCILDDMVQSIHVQSWLNSESPNTERALSRNTKIAYASQVKDFLAFAEGKEYNTQLGLSYMQSIILRTTVGDLKKAKASALVRTARAYCRFLFRNGHISTMVFNAEDVRAIRVPPCERRTRVLSAEQFRELRYAAQLYDAGRAPRRELAMYLLTLTGMRIHEVVHLSVDSITMRKDGTLRVRAGVKGMTKTGARTTTVSAEHAEHVLSLFAAMVDDLATKRSLTPEDQRHYLYTGANRHSALVVLRSQLAPVMDECGADRHSLHDIRRTFITNTVNGEGEELSVGLIRFSKEIGCSLPVLAKYHQQED